MKISVIIPVYNDWVSLKDIVPDIIKNLRSITPDFNIYAVNDCSSLKLPSQEFEVFENFHFIHLVRNLGHQKAISIGLSYLNEYDDADCIVVMDGDGEDRPSDIASLVKKYIQLDAESIVFAKRTQRHEGIGFKIMYQIYKRIFRILTGKIIAFGNFSVIPRKYLNKIVHVSETWNHYSGGIIRSKLPYSSLPIEKGFRVHGISQMNTTSLVIHGVSSIAVHLDVVSVRLLIFASSLIALVVLGLISTFSIRIFTPWAIPGWATTVFVGLGIILLQAFFMCLLLTFMVLFYRTQKQFIPAKEYKLFIDKI